MKRFTALILACVFFAAPAWAAKAPEKGTAIVIAAFGSTYPEGRKSLADLQKAVETAYPGYTVRMAFTAAKVRAKIRETDARTPSLEAALAELSDAGYKRVAVLSAHIIPGMEYQDVLHISSALQDLPKGLDEVSASLPLIGCEVDAEELAEVLRGAFPQGQEPGKAVLFVGHGTHGPGSLAYPALAWSLQAAGKGTYVVSSIENENGMENALAQLKQAGAKEVTVVPLMAVAGDHANNDIFGTEDDSISSVLKAKGYVVREHNDGLGSLKPVQKLWLDRLKDALRELER